jgi:hypothetical protein
VKISKAEVVIHTEQGLTICYKSDLKRRLTSALVNMVLKDK